jgi:hypothetical protein
MLEGNGFSPMHVRSVQLPSSESTSHHVMEIGGGGLIRQKFTRDEHPERWLDLHEGTLRFHMIDEQHFEEQTGFRLGPRNAPGKQQSLFLVEDPLRPFIGESEMSGLPSAAQVFKDRPRKDKAQTLPSAIPARPTVNGRQAKEKARAKWTIGKLVRCLFSCNT